MSRGTFFGIEIGRTGLSTAQFGLDTTGHNIANVDTAGYTRQRIVSTAYDPYSTIGKFAPVPGHQLVGGGVRIQILDQIRSAYLDRRFRTESTNFAYWETRTQSLSYVESFFDQVNEKISLNSTMADFFGAMSLLSQDPLSGAARTQMQTTAMDLVQQINSIYAGLIDLQQSENRAVMTKVEDINTIAESIAELNKQIYVYEITGMIANDLRDKRNLLVDKLAEYIDIEYDEYPDPVNPDHGMFKIMIAGVELVNHEKVAKLGVRTEERDANGDVIREIRNVIPGEDNVYEVYWESVIDGSVFAGRAMDWNRITGGSLQAHIDVRDGNEYRYVWNDTTGEYEPVKTVDSRYKGIPYYVDMMNDLARILVSEINNIHRAGWSDNPEYSMTNVDFFLEEPDWVTFRHSGGAVYEWNPALQAWENGGDTISKDPVTGEYIFTPAPGNPDVPMSEFTRELDILKITAKNIDISQAIKDSAYNIACSTEMISRAASNNPLETQRGNNENIKALYDLFKRTNLKISRPDIHGNQKDVDIGGFADFSTVIRFDLGKTLYTAKQTGETSRILKLSAENQKTSIAGVSLDEEMVGIVRYQHAYNGAARVITAMDEALDKLINGTGRVGL